MAQEKDRITKEKDGLIEILNLEKINLLRDKEQILQQHNKQMLVMEQEFERLKAEQAVAVRGKAEEATKAALRKLSGELAAMLGSVELPEHLKQVVPLPASSVNSLQDRDLEQMAKGLN